jgi:hypothetical protein
MPQVKNYCGDHALSSAPSHPLVSSPINYFSDNKPNILWYNLPVHKNVFLPLFIKNQLNSM